MLSTKGIALNQGASAYIGLLFRKSRLETLDALPTMPNVFVAKLLLFPKPPPIEIIEHTITVSCGGETYALTISGRIERVTATKGQHSDPGAHRQGEATAALTKAKRAQQPVTAAVPEPKPLASVGAPAPGGCAVRSPDESEGHRLLPTRYAPPQ